MDITEAFRTEDLAKADFFDFVVTPDNGDAQFQKQMRTVNAYLANSGVVDDKEANNNNNSTNSNNNNSIGIPSAADLASIPTSQADGNFDLNFWADKDTVRLETAILEDLNKYCWNAAAADEDVVVGNGIAHTGIKHLTNNNNAAAHNNNSGGGNNAVGADGGHIYTLTVLNGIDQGGGWYRPLMKDDDGSVVASPTSMDHLQPGIDIDSILNIMPSQLNAFNNNYAEGGINQTTDGMIKSETYTYEDSGFADNKDELANSLIIDTPLLETHDGYNNSNNNNNDWKLSNNNVVTNGASGGGTADSLLRSALQGKAFVRYNGVKKENNVELRRVLSTPPTKNEMMDDKIPTIVAGIDANGTVIFEEELPPQARIADENNPTSTHHMDDILLSQLDQTYPEDFEKLKRFASEVAENVHQFCQIDTSMPSIYSIVPDQINLLSTLNSPIAPMNSAPVVTSTKPTLPTTTSARPASTAKKYKRQNSGAQASAGSGGSAGGGGGGGGGGGPGGGPGGGANNANSGSKQTTVQNATSTSNGVRKERSLHYCSICSKGFKDKYSVNVHIRTHTGEKPFACTLCGKSFRQKAHLAKHYQTHIAQKNAAEAGGGVKSKTRLPDTPTPPR